MNLMVGAVCGIIRTQQWLQNFKHLFKFLDIINVNIYDFIIYMYIISNWKYINTNQTDCKKITK